MTLEQKAKDNLEQHEQVVMEEIQNNGVLMLPFYGKLG